MVLDLFYRKFVIAVFFEKLPVGDIVSFLFNVIKIFFFYLDGEFEHLEISPLSPPPELPDVMKPQESASHTQEQVSSPVAKS